MRPPHYLINVKKKSNARSDSVSFFLQSIVERERLIQDMAVSSVGRGGSWRLLCEVKPQIQLPNTPLFLQTSKPRRSCSIVARALDPKTREAQNSTTSQEEDLWYVAKLGAGSFVGAAVIKYGSALFPQITTPNLVLALTIISTPVLVAIILLINQSRLNS
ncbi:hypothetical protein RIF29_28269 [Crotalaria pallida]|uniref:Uncharacterized protein n=1 Tax=Crotalaria pallida TaxID=3830 RepID=A0AAN9EVF7_CROPI